MNPVRPWGVSDCGSSEPEPADVGVRMSSTIASSSPRQTATVPQTLWAHSPADDRLAAVVVSEQRRDADDRDDAGNDGRDPDEWAAS